MYRITKYTGSNHISSVIHKLEDGIWIPSVHGLEYYIKTKNPVEGNFMHRDLVGIFNGLINVYESEVIAELRNDRELEDYINKMIIAKELEL